MTERKRGVLSVEQLTLAKDVRITTDAVSDDDRPLFLKKFMTS